jgi:hypothetical protein
MMVRLRSFVPVLACVVVAGCDGAFDLAHVPSVDAAIDAPLGTCVEDDFEAGIIDGQWFLTGVSAGVVVSVQSGHAVFSIPASTTDNQDPYGGLGTDTRDLTGAVAQVEILAVSSATDTSEVVMQFGVDSKNSYSMLVQRHRLITRKFVDNLQTNDTIPYDSVQHRFIRMRHDLVADAMVYEARSADGEWTEVSRTTANVALTSATLAIYAGSYNVAPAFDAIVDNALLLGPCGF